MKTKIAAYIGVITLLLFRFIEVNAQQSSLGISNFIYPDTAYEGTLYTIQATIQNTGNNTFFGSINIVTENTDSTYANDTLVYNQSITLPFPGDTATFTISQHQFTPSNFKAGINIVVVWPRAANGSSTPTDSLVDSVYFIPLSGVHGENQNANGLFLYPNPAKDFIYLDEQSNNSFEHVRIFDSKGTLVQSLVKPGAKIDIYSLCDGLYLLEVKRKNLPAAYQKFIKQQE